MPAAVTRLNPTDLPNSGSIGYSQISISEPGRLAFVSGQVAWRPEGGAVPQALESQAAIVVANLRHALAALGARPDDIVQMRIFALDLRPEAQATIMGALAGFLDGAKPSLTGVGVAALATPELQLEIEMVVRPPG
ncbi:MAG: RidA family protein [Salinarimonas sp.]